MIPEGETKTCKMCSMGIPTTAKKCPYCHHWQRWLSLQNPLLGIVIAVFAILAVGGCGTEETVRERQKQKAIVPAIGEALPIIDGNNHFAFDLYAKLREKHTDNLFFSPYSISTALAMTYGGARGETEKEMAQVLHFSVPQDRLSSAFAALMANLWNEEKGNQLWIANRLWGQQGHDFLPEFQRVTREDYGAAPALLDFAKAEKARQAINAWTKKETDGKIRDLIPSDMLNALTRLVLTNAIYFNAKWANPFDKKGTEEAPFKITPTQTVSVPMMCQKDELKYGTMDDAQILELPYVGKTWSMLIVLPNTVDGLVDLEKRLDFTESQKWLSILQRKEVVVWLPKFTFASQLFLKEALESMGMSSAFSEIDADFSGMDGKRDLFISMVIHNAFVDVNETGTEAAATTAVNTDLSCDEPPQFRADHPFVFFIRNNGTGAILFIGRVVNPKE